MFAFTLFLAFACIGIISSQVWPELHYEFSLLPWNGFNEAPLKVTPLGLIVGSFRQFDNDCLEDGPFLGRRFMSNNDPSIILIYDVNGYIAGVQSAFPVSKIQSENKFNSRSYQQVMFVRDRIYNEDCYLLTAYFVDPNTICSPGRNETSFNKQGVGENLYFQQGPVKRSPNGTIPDSNFVRIPRLETDLGNTPWVKGKCFSKMGLHYWYNVSKNMNCDYFYPAFLLFKDGELSGFGWTTFIRFQSNNFENSIWFLANISFQQVMTVVPDCLVSMMRTVGTTALHHYFTRSPRQNLVCPSG